MHIYPSQCQRLLNVQIMSRGCEYSAEHLLAVFMSGRIYSRVFLLWIPSLEKLVKESLSMAPDFMLSKSHIILQFQTYCLKAINGGWKWVLRSKQVSQVRIVFLEKKSGLCIFILMMDLNTPFKKRNSKLMEFCMELWSQISQDKLKLQMRQTLCKQSFSLTLINSLTSNP